MGKASAHEAQYAAGLIRAVDRRPNPPRRTGRVAMLCAALFWLPVSGQLAQQAHHGTTHPLVMSSRVSDHVGWRHGSQANGGTVGLRIAPTTAKRTAGPAPTTKPYSPAWFHTRVFPMCTRMPAPLNNRSANKSYKNLPKCRHRRGTQTTLHRATSVP